MVSRQLRLAAFLLLAGLAGCASAPADWGRADVGRMTAARGIALPETVDAKAFTSQALRAPLTADTAVQLALINNPAVRREAARLGIAAVEVYEAGRLANPTFSLTRLAGDSSAGANVPQLTLGIAFNFVNLLFLPANTRYAQARFEAAKLGAASTTLILSAQVEAAWFDAVGDDQLAQMRKAAAEAQRASADLAQRYFDAGNMSARELAMERAAASQSMLAAISARAAAMASRSSLNRLMGLAADQGHWSLDARLPEPLSQEDDVAALQRLALDNRLDLAALRRTSQAIASRFGLTRRTRLIDGLEIGVERERDYDGALDVGPTLSLELPLFNWGGGRVAAARAALDEAEAELDGRVLDVVSEVQLAAAKVDASRSLAHEYRSALIPLLETVVAQAQKEQNFMLIGIFEVILAKQQEYEAYAGYIEAVRDYWTARSELARAVGRELPSSRQPAAPMLDATEILRPRGGGGMDHSKHSMGGKSQDMKDTDMDLDLDLDTDMESMPGMSGMDHAQPGKSAPASPGPKSGMKGGMEMKDRPAMDHSDHGTSAPSRSAPKDGMEGMPIKGMNPGSARDPAPAASGNEARPAGCAAMKTMDLRKVDPTVAAALRARCGSPDDPRAGRDVGDQSMEGMDNGSPKPAAPASEAPHAH